jgi:predicted nicotinamide N-methyase
VKIVSGDPIIFFKRRLDNKGNRVFLLDVHRDDLSKGKL